ITGIQFDQFATMIQAVVSGLGAAIVPKYLVENELKQGRLVGLGGSATSVIGSYFLVWPERSAHHPPVMAFQKWMKSLVGENAII
ncbi:MAG: LysR substrate-binding domain-containing protein, partial [Alphaproteobacteria bacterium]